jgi:uncharacterized glyoxalase superfamily protein PhnB
VTSQSSVQRNRSMPPGIFIPELAYDNVPGAAAWLCRAFGFSERLRIGGHRVQLSYGEGSMVVIEGPRSAAGEPRHGTMVRVDDVDQHCDQAKRGGATIVRAPETHPYGERQYTAQDPGGHRWTFSQSVEDVDPADWGGELLQRE